MAGYCALYVHEFWFAVLQWMSVHWRSDPCYAAYGVDGSECSFRIYLSEVSTGGDTEVRGGAGLQG